MATLPFFVIPTPLGTVTSGNELSTNPGSHLGEFDAAGMTWRGSGTSNTYVRGDFGSAKEIDFAAMLAGNAGSSDQFRLKLGDSQAEVDGTADYDSGLINFINPTISRSDGLYHSHLSMGTAYTKRWWRFNMSVAATFEAAFLILGKRLTPANWYSPGFGFGVNDKAKAEISPHRLIERIPGQKTRTVSFRLGWMSEQEMEETWRPFDEIVGTSSPVFCCFDPTSNTYRQNRTFFGLLSENPYARQVVTTASGPRFERSFEIESLI